jgi:3-oxoacyl-[acyl-carrier-protein] synthase III
MKAAILGIGEWRPETIRDNSAWPADFGKPDAAHEDMNAYRNFGAGAGTDPCDVITARHLALEVGDPFAGSTRRRIADAGMTNCEAEARASRAALTDAQVDAGDVDYIVSWTLVPDRVTPPSPSRVTHLIGATRAIAVGMDIGCAAIVGQILFAASLIESGRARNVLVTGSHLATRAFPLLHPASPGFGDVATAMLIGPSERAGILSTFGVTHGEYYDTVAWRRSKENDTPWYVAGGPMHLGSYDREGFAQIFRDTVRFGRDTVAEAARRSGLPVSEIDLLASVQPRRWLPAAIAEALGLSPDRAPQTYDELAHLGSCGVVTNLIEARRRGLLSPRPDGAPRTVALYAQGAGFTRAAVILRWVA